MAGLPPGQVLIQPWSSSQGKYVSYTTEPAAVRGYVACDGDTVFNSSSRIAVERAAVSSNFVHLRFTHSNKYWARRGPGPQDHWIIASSDQPEEDTSKLSCTLFEPSLGDDGSLSLTHVQSGGRVRVDLQPDRVYVEDRNTRDSTDLYSFRFVDWDTLVGMPQYVSFKGDNDKFIRAQMITASPFPFYLQFASDDGNEEKCAYEVFYTHDGHVRIKTVYNPWSTSGFWALGRSNFIAALVEDGSATVRDDTWFWPVKIDDRTIALRNTENNNFCGRLSMEGWDNYLNAADRNLSTQTRLVVSERVLERNIYDVTYRMEDARIYDERPWVAGIGIAYNDADTEATLAIRVSYEYTTTNSFSNSLSIMAGVKTEMKAGIPFLAEGKIEVSTEVTTSFEWGSATEETQTSEATFTATVPGKSRARINYVATHGRCDIPFSYTQRDKSSFDGQFVTSLHDDGIFNGVNYFSFRFEQLAIEPLY